MDSARMNRKTFLKIDHKSRHNRVSTMLASYQAKMGCQWSTTAYVIISASGAPQPQLNPL
jgi:hypothetical protein